LIQRDNRFSEVAARRAVELEDHWYIVLATSMIPVTATPAPGINSISRVVCDNSSVIGGGLQGINKVSYKVSKF
jgi:hypothetical protein